MDVRSALGPSERCTPYHRGVIDYDVIVAGGGHNGLVCAAYLAKAGRRVLVLEARSTVGGCASTVDAVGARVNICNCDHIFIRGTPVVDELELTDYGLEYLDVDPSLVSLSWEGEPPWMLYTDPERTLDSVAAQYPGEVDGYRRYLADALPLARLLLDLGSAMPTPGGVARTLASRRGAGATTLRKWMQASTTEILDSYFNHDHLKAPAVVLGPAVWGVEPGTPGTGLGALGYAFRHGIGVGRPVGGSGGLPDALANCITDHGGEIRCNAPVAGIITDGARATGVELADGETIRAGGVIAACDPRRAIVDWLGLDPALGRETLTRYSAGEPPQGYESKIDARTDSPPTYAALAATPFVDVDGAAGATTIVAPSMGAIRAAFDASQHKAVAELPMFVANTPTVLDPSMAAEGEHVFSLEVLWTPYDLHGGWDESSEPERWLDLFCDRVAPGFDQHVKEWRCVTPLDYERDFGLIAGWAPSFVGRPYDAVMGRQREGSRYRLPIPNAYLTGAGTYPGAGIWGTPGRNCAKVVLSDQPATAVSGE